MVLVRAVQIKIAMRLYTFLLVTFSLAEAAKGPYKFSSVHSEIIQDSGRIRGIRNRYNKSFVLGGLFPISIHSNSVRSPCGDLWPATGFEVEAMMYAIDIINSDSALLPGVELGYDIRDTCHSETVGLDEAMDLIISDRRERSCMSSNSTAYDAIVPATSGIVGASISRVSVPVASLARLFNVPQVSYASTSPLLSDRTRYSYFRRTVPPDNLQVSAIIDLLRHFGWNYVSFLHSEDTYGSAGVSTFVNASAPHGICIDLRQGIPPSFSDSDYDNLVTDLRDSTAKVVIFFAGQLSVREVLKRVNQDSRLRNNFVWIASDGWANDVHRLHDSAASVIGITPYTTYLKSFDEYVSRLTINSNTRNSWFPELFANFAKCTLGKDCDNDTNMTSFSTYQQDAFIPFVVDAVYAIAHALHDFLADNCNRTENAPFTWFKENGTCSGQSRDLNGASLLEYLGKVNFTSSITKNSITFDRSGSVQGSYKILNYQASSSEGGQKRRLPIYRTVGTWTNGKLIINDDVEVQFGVNSDGSVRNKPVESSCGKCSPGTYVRQIPGSCCSICEPCLGMNFSSEPLAEECSSCLVEGEREMWGNSPFTGSNRCVLIPETSAMYSDPWAIPSLFLACVGLLCVAITSAIFGIYWKTPIVKSSGREQMILLLIGITCSFILPFFYVVPPSVPICLVNRLGIWFCYSLMFGALAIKAQRIARIFYGVKRNLHLIPPFSTPIYQVIFTLIIVAIQMILIVLSLAIVHPEVERHTRYDQDGRLGLPEVIIVCQKEETAVVALSLFYETCIIAVATILGIFSFKFPKNFNEAKYISFCTFSLLVVWLGLILAYFTTESRPEIQNATLSLFIILSAFGVLCFIFGPKLFIAIFHPGRNRFTTTHHNETEPGTEIKQQTI